MVYLNGDFIAKNKASISIMDRGFLFGDGVYEVIPVYNGKIFRLQAHLDRLQKSLDSIQITNPYKTKKYLDILTQLISFSSVKDQSIYLQITRGADTQRKHIFDALIPTIYIESNPLISKQNKSYRKVLAPLVLRTFAGVDATLSRSLYLPIFFMLKMQKNTTLKRLFFTATIKLPKVPLQMYSCLKTMHYSPTLLAITSCLALLEI